MALKIREEIDILNRQNGKFHSSSFTGQNMGVNPFFESWIRRPADEWLTRWSEVIARLTAANCSPSTMHRQWQGTRAVILTEKNKIWVPGVEQRKSNVWIIYSVQKIWWTFRNTVAGNSEMKRKWRRSLASCIFGLQRKLLPGFELPLHSNSKLEWPESRQACSCIMIGCIWWEVTATSYHWLLK